MILSVIIPVYNCEKYIRQCVYSILLQPCAKEIEIIIVDDGSPDKSGNICDEIADEYDNVIVIHKENGGLSAARNSGLEKATGEYIALVDGDDYWEKGFFDQNILKELSKGYDLYGFSYNHILCSKYYKKIEIQTETKFFDKYCRGKCDYNLVCSYFFKSDIIRQNNLDFPAGIILCEDMIFLEKYFYFVLAYQKMDRVIYDYRKNDDSITHTSKWTDTIWFKYNAYCGIRDWYNSIGEEYNLDSVCGMIFSEILDDLCGENAYKYCKDYINSDKRIECVKDYKNIGIPPYYYPKVKHFMEHTFLFWICKKAKYKVSKALMFLAQKFSFLLKFYEYIIFVKIRGYKKIEN